MIPIARPDLGAEEIAAVTEVIESGMLAQGRRVKELEDAWAGFVGVKHAIAVNSGPADSADWALKALEQYTHNIG